MSKGDKNHSRGKKWQEGAERLWGDKCRLNHKHEKECVGYENINDDVDNVESK